MTKRNPGLTRHPGNFYPTPPWVTEVLVPHLMVEGLAYAEPCAGEGAIIDVLDRHGFTCLYHADKDEDARTFKKYPFQDFNVTNPPWDRTRVLLHEIMDRLIETGLPTWLLLPSDWMFNQNASGRLKYVTDIVCVGRVKWIPDSESSGYDNVAWFRLLNSASGQVRLHGQKRKPR